MVSLKLLIEAFFAYMKLVTDQPQPCCAICGTFPMGLICDGMSLAVFSSELEHLCSFGHPTGVTVPKHQVRLVLCETAGDVM
jgi:hypothetical protein